MINTKKVCVFVDGENLRHSIVDLFPYPSFDQKLYLPKTDWTKFFDWITEKVVGTNFERVRTYWYVLKNIDFAPENLKSVCQSAILLERLLRKSTRFAEKLDIATDHDAHEKVLHEFADELRNNRTQMQNRFDGWINIQNLISQSSASIEFRRAGSIRYDLLTRALGSEKAVDVKLATDLILLKDIYDVAIIVSGDQDYVPAVDSIKDFGKHTVNVAFRKADGRLLPNGAKRLNQSTDRSIELSHSEMKQYLQL